MQTPKRRQQGETIPHGNRPHMGQAQQIQEARTSPTKTKGQADRRQTTNKQPSPRQYKQQRGDTQKTHGGEPKQLHHADENEHRPIHHIQAAENGAQPTQHYAAKKLKTQQVLMFDIRNPGTSRQLWSRRGENSEHAYRVRHIETSGRYRKKKTSLREEHKGKNTSE